MHTTPGRAMAPGRLPRSGGARHLPPRPARVQPFLAIPRIAAARQALPDARLLLHPVALGLRAADPETQGNGAPAIPGGGAATVQALRSTIQLAPDREEALLATAVRAFLERTEGPGLDEESVQAQLAAWPRRGRGEVLLLPWPIDRTGVFLELRIGEQLIDPELREPGDLALPAIASLEELALDRDRVLATTRSIATGLLHFELEFWSQRSAAWNNLSGQGAETRWDSARAGLLHGESETAPGFALDLDSASLGDPRDDVWPRWARLTLVVARNQATAPESYLAQPLSAMDTELVVTRPEDLPDLQETPWLKVDAEWVRCSELVGARATGLRRGGRGTTARDHARGAAVRAGREVVLYVPLAVGRDSDD